ncbi:MAG: caspase family protein [Candidatus Moraniibacteriota bacterium]
MKKIVTIILVALFFWGTGLANAQKEEKVKLKAENIQIKTKKPISNEEINKLEELYPKGKPSTSVDSVTKFIFPATGINAPAVVGQKYAIVIGMANYPGMDFDLCVPEARTDLSMPISGLSLYCKDDDSHHMKNTLISSDYGFNAENIRWIADADATYDNIKTAVDEIKLKLTENDELVFFFSGHGFTGQFNDPTGVSDSDKDGVDEAIGIYDSTYPTDESILADPTVLDNYDYTKSNALIFDDELRNWFVNSPTSRIAFIFDICGAGGMSDLAGEGRVLAMSSLEGQTSYTYYLGGTYTSATTIQESQGLFSHYFVNNGMESGLADGYNLLSKRDAKKYDGKVSIEEAFGYAYPIIKSVKPQTSILNDSDKLLDFLP